MLSKSCPISVFFVLAWIGAFTCISCEPRIHSRTYTEIVLESSPKDMSGHAGHGHNFSDKLPEGHPDISSSMDLPVGEDKAEVQKALNASVARLPLSWKVPEGWTEEKGSGMRVVTFRADSVETSIVSLGGAAGGMESNVLRWIKQINLPVPPANQLNLFLSRQVVLTTQGGFKITIIDLTELANAHQTDAPGMMGAIAELPYKTIFVKMTGPHDALVRQREAFKLLCTSLNIN